MQREPEDLVSALPLADRVRLLSGSGFWQLEPVGGEDPVTITDGPHGLRLQIESDDHLGVAGSRPATCFPTASALGATWDPDLLHEVGAALGRECRAAGVGGLLGPGLNLKRHPAGGRNFEYLSEDPLLSGRLAAALVRGIQSEGVAACPKHYVVNNQETFRMTVDAVVDDRTLRELYLSGFETVVREGRPWMVMSSYNRVNGTYAGESRRLVTEILRDEWGFDGVVVSDWGAVDDRVAGVRAGMDLEMPGGAGSHDRDVLAAVRDGRLSEADVDRSAARVAALARRVGGPPADPDPGLHDRHHELARRAAVAGTVLLTNDGTLPLGAPPRLAVVGAFADQPRYQGAGSSRVAPTRLDTALDALRARLPEGTVDYAPGYDPSTGAAGDQQIAAAETAAAAAEVVVTFLGLPPGHETEGVDRSDLRLPDGHHRLVQALLRTNPRLVVVLCNGAPVELPWADRPAAVIEAYLGGQAGGSAIADVLLGDAEPGGRLAESFPVVQADLPADRNFPGHPRQVEYREGLYVGYRFHTTAGVPARFPFGHGLGYSTFAYDDLRVVADDAGREVQVTVTNTGDRAGSEIVQVYLRPLEPSLHRPDRELVGFAKVHLEPGAGRDVTVALPDRAFEVWDVEAGRWRVDGGGYEVLVGASATDVRATGHLEVPGGEAPRGTPRPAGFVASDDEFAAMLGRPIPTPAPTRPFRPNSTVADLRASPVGRVIRAGILWQGKREARREFAGMAEDLDALMDATVDQLPLRALASLSRGRIPHAAIDRLVAALNGDWRRALRRS